LIKKSENLLVRELANMVD